MLKHALLKRPKALIEKLARGSKPPKSRPDPVSLPALLQRVRSHGDRGARRWAREMSIRNTSLSRKQFARRWKRNRMARESRRRNRAA